jgi:lysophospholipase L1-like esterase
MTINLRNRRELPSVRAPTLLRFTLAFLIASVIVNVALGFAIYEGITTPHSISALLRRSRPEEGLLACWGDSLTAGANANFGHDFPRLVGAALGRAVFNGAFGGDTSTQIKRHMLARAAGLDEGVTIIWAGRNDFEQPDTVKANIAEMIASLPPGSHFLVLEILNGAYPGEGLGGSKYNVLNRLNSDLSATYGEHFLPVRKHLVSLYNLNNADDLLDNAQDVVPSSIRSDSIHLNDIGYSLVAAYVEESIVRLGW